ncbi:NOB1 family endonuclease [Halococcus qingdaonensis]|uniref:NOB1 family endonuclease n=1 Tax=Halococcus qingdaonensis TaxID=224402 RepID=UPI0021161080|nr:NOB1 family endonuclease [Halococcus qingdaonensis]
MEILDASAFINEYDAGDDIATVPAVGAELDGESSYRYDALEGAGMYIHVPEEAVIGRIERAASESGDKEELSETDIELLAAAFELDAKLVTDDYAMQNVAERLDIYVEFIARDGITEQRDWDFQCQGCGRVFDENKDRCPICGSGLTRKNPS